MNEAKYPLGKLQQLAAAHTCIVDLLTALRQSSSSADEILPTLIYTLITTPPEGINVISNLHFIQRFRAASKVDGEAAYCLVNLEAAITFLETVDLASLRSDEPLEGPGKSASRPTTPHEGSLPESSSRRPKSTSLSSPAVTPLNASPQPPNFDDPLHSPGSEKTMITPSPSHQRKLSNLFQPPAALGAAGDAVDQGLKTIGSTLDNSFKLLFGRLKEHKVVGEGVDAEGTIVVPKTLDDARRLVEPKAEEDEGNMIISADPVADAEEQGASSNKSDDSLLVAFAGRKQSRDRSVDSIQSSGSGKRVAFAAGNSVTQSRVSPSAGASNGPTHAGNAAVESMRSLGNAFNPLKSFGGMSVFGRSSSSNGPTSAPMPAMKSAASPDKIKEMQETNGLGNDPPIKALPPIQRFLDVTSVEELKIGEVNELLNDYKRIAEVLKNFSAF
ncbi:hypothetical protein P7C71_g361, partial [Lecanoromycetidae sp. Uapishka_2]